MTAAEYKFVVTDYWEGKERTHEHVLHSTKSDKVWSAYDIVNKALGRLGVTDGDEISILISRTGRRPFGSRRVFLVDLYNYEREKAEPSHGT